MARHRKAWGKEDREQAGAILRGFAAFCVMVYVGMHIGGAVGGFFILGALPAAFLVEPLLAWLRSRSEVRASSTTYNTAGPAMSKPDRGTESPPVERPPVESPTDASGDKKITQPAPSGRSGASPLRDQLRQIPNMSGATFERYMANLFQEAWGCKVTLLGGAGDQGVDLIVHWDTARAAVQCKNHRRPVGNTPVQEVLAGKLYHKAGVAIVVAPAGYTEGAVALARETDVCLYSYRAIEKLIQQAEQRAKEHDASTTLPNPEDGDPDPTDSEKQVSSRSHQYVVGDTATLATGETLTVHSYESPVALQPTRQPEEGYEIVAIDVEWCAGTNLGEGTTQVNPYYFSLHMPDNTRMQWASHKEPKLPLTTLLAGDCVRGWITFQKPTDVKPRFIIYAKESSVVKWFVG